MAAIREELAVADVVMRFPTGRLRISRIVYFTDLQHTDSREIPVGVVGEVVLPTLRFIGTALRPSFGDTEAALMAPMMRDLLRRPTAALWPEIVDIFEHGEPGHTLELFAARHSSSLSVMAPRLVDVPRQWLLEQNRTRLDRLVTDRMKVYLTDEYFDFLYPPRDGPGIDDPTVKEEVKKLVA